MILWRPYTQMQSSSPPILLDSAKGSFLYTKNGRKIFDGISSWWLITHGHGQEDIVEAIAKQAEKLEQVVFSNFTHEPAEELSELLESFLPKDLSSLFLSDNGSTAVEVAMKMAYQFAIQTGKPKKSKFVAFTHSYHGDTCGVMSVSATSAFNKPYKGMLFEVLRADQGTSMTDPLSQWVHSFKKIMEAQGNEVCAVLLEPLIQGAGGMIQWPIEAIQQIYDIAKSHDCLVIFDEVMTGFGRTGTMFAFEQIKRTPDLLCLSKGITGGFLPLGATIASKEIYTAFLSHDVDKMLFHGHSYTGNALSCAAACANLKLFKKINFIQIISKMANAHRESLKNISNHPLIQKSNVCGSIATINLNHSNKYGNSISREIQKMALQLNLFIRPLGNTIYLMPPYCSTPEEITTAWSKLNTILNSNIELFSELEELN